MGEAAGFAQFAFGCLCIGQSFCNLDGISAAVVRKGVPDVPTAAHGEQPELAVVPLTMHKSEHLLGVLSRQPLGFRHGRYSLFNSRSTTQHPLTCSPGCRQCCKMSAFVQPASSR